MENNHGDTEDTELHEEEAEGKYKIHLLSVFLCDLRAFVVEITQCRMI